MISVTAAQLDLWMASFLFPLARVMGLIAAAPVFSNRAFVMRARLALGLLITFAIVPTLPPSGLHRQPTSHRPEPAPTPVH